MPARPPRPSASSIIPAAPTRSAKCTKAPRRWIGWSRSRSAASPSRRPRRPAMARPSHQHHRHPGPRRLHHRSRASLARARRRRHRVRLRRRRRAAVRDGVAPGRQVRRAAHLLRQQDGPHRRGLLPLRPDDQGPPRREAAGVPAADRRRERFRRPGRPGRHEEPDLEGRERWAPSSPSARSRPSTKEKAEEYHHELVELCVELDEDGDGSLSRRQAARRRDAEEADPQGHHHRRLRAGAVRLRLQEQGRAADAGRRRRLPAVAAGCAGREGPRGRRRHRTDPQGRRRRAVLRPRLQDHDRSVRRLADLRARLFRRAGQQHPGASIR